MAVQAGHPATARRAWLEVAHELSECICPTNQVGARVVAVVMAVEAPKAKYRRLSSVMQTREPPQGKAFVDFMSDWPSQLPHLRDSVLACTGSKTVDFMDMPPTSTIWVTTSYSGIGTFEHCMASIMYAYEMDLVTNGVARPKPSVKFWSASEYDEVARDILLKSSCCPEHVFGDICDRLPWSDVEKMPFAVKALNDRLKVATKNAQTTNERKKAKEASNDRCLDKLLQIANNAFQKGAGKERGICFKHGQMCPYSPPMGPRDIRLEAGGNTCVSFSPQGGQAKWLHESGPVAATWLAWCKAHADVIFQECSHHFNTGDTMGRAFLPGQGWQTSVLQLAARDVGVPMNRPRNWSWTIRKSKLRMLMDLDYDLFKKVCGSPLTCSGHDVFVMSPSSAADFLKEVGAEKSPHQVEGRRFLTMGCLNRLEDYGAHLAARMEAGEDVVVPVVDLTQNVIVRQNLSEMLPSLLCHSVMWSFRHKRVLTPPELFHLMGWPVPFEELDTKAHGLPWDPTELFKMRDSVAAKVTGNGFHCRLVGLLLGLCLTITERLPEDPQDVAK